MKVVIIIFLLIVDAVGSAAAFKLTYMIRFESGVFANPLPAELLEPLVWMIGFWLAIFALRGMYRTPTALSRFDEIVRCFKTVVIGIFIIFLATFDIQQPIALNRLFLLIYGMILFVLTVIGRVLVRNYQRWLRNRGIGLWKVVIVGFNDVGRRLHDQLHHYPVWGFKVEGYVDSQEPDHPIEPGNPDLERGEHHGVPIIGRVEELSEIVASRKIDWVLVAPQRYAHETLLKVFDHCTVRHVRFMIVADFYHMVVGMMRTVTIHGLPLVEVVPQLVPASVLFIKRIADIVVGLIFGLFAIGLTPLIALAIKLESSGPIFQTEQRLTKGRREFRLIRFRTSSRVTDGQGDDPPETEKTTRIGRLLQITQLNDLPMFINLLKGDMSLVGPSPELRKTVEERRKSVPLYDRRFRIRAGLTGWTQLREKTGQGPKDVREKTGYDLFYLDHISLTLDLKIVLSTIMIIIKGNW
ncbi:MAG: sugar transferase [Candidatus Electryoneaceae bacterium]|nr:sugar transferase [Candidatus Electryoneaceae bacterium]